MMKNKQQSYPYSELTHKIIGAIYKVVNELGYGYQEKYYQRALAEEFKLSDLNFEKEKDIVIKYNDKIIGRYFMDFVINKAVVLELKVALDFYESHINQILAYMKSGDYKIGLLVIITKTGVKVKRLIN